MNEPASRLTFSSSESLDSTSSTLIEAMPENERGGQYEGSERLDRTVKTLTSSYNMSCTYPYMVAHDHTSMGIFALERLIANTTQAIRNSTARRSVYLRTLMRTQLGIRWRPGSPSA